MKAVLFMAILQLVAEPAPTPPVPQQAPVPNVRLELRTQSFTEFGSMKACKSFADNVSMGLARFPTLVIITSCSPYDIGELEVLPKGKPQGVQPPPIPGPKISS